MTQAAAGPRSREEITAALRSLCQSTPRCPSLPIPTALDPIDALLPRGGLDRHAVHEWLGLAEVSDPDRRASRSRWSPPLAVLTHLARRAIRAGESASQPSGHLIWIGPAVWPYLPALTDPRAIAHSLFIRAECPADRLWAIDLALRSRAPAAVIADASGFDLAATRRLQLAAEVGHSLCLLARPSWERAVLSAAGTRWLVRSVPSSSDAPQWTVELLRCKGVQPTPEAPRLWTLERSHATRTVAVVPDLLDRPDRTQAGENAARRIG